MSQAVDTDYEADLKAIEKIGASPLKNPPKPIDKSLKRDSMDIKVMKEEVKKLEARLDTVERLLQKYMKITKTASYTAENKPKIKINPLPKKV